jgi:hypothetical protein
MLGRLRIVLSAMTSTDEFVLPMETTNLPSVGVDIHHISRVSLLSIDFVNTRFFCYIEGSQSDRANVRAR